MSLVSRPLFLVPCPFSFFPTVAAPHGHCPPRARPPEVKPRGRSPSWTPRCPQGLGDQKGINPLGSRLEAGPGLPAIPPPSLAPLRCCLHLEESALAEEQITGFTRFYLNILPSVTAQQTPCAFREAAMASNAQKADKSRNRRKKMEVSGAV